MSVEGEEAATSSIDAQYHTIFSDVHEVDTADSVGSSSPITLFQSRAEGPSQENHDDSQVGPQESSLHATMMHLDQLSSSGQLDTAESSTHHRRVMSTGTQRTSSDSSRIPSSRAADPYQGSTAPSHPYGLYPQSADDFNSSVDAISQPVEIPIISQSGPSHPYSVFAQTTMPEDSSSATRFQVDLPSTIQSVRPGLNSSGNEVGDIVGTDGHVERLPPYSRFADNVVAKGDMFSIDQERSAVNEQSISPTPVLPTGDSESHVDLITSGARLTQEQVASGEGLTEKRRPKLYCGLSIRTLLVVAVVVVCAAVIGGVVGGVVGNHTGADEVEEYVCHTQAGAPC